MRFDYTPEHIVQVNIVSKLLHAETLRFSDLKPKGVESNLFMYHLNQLLKHDIVVKTEDGYSLGNAGKAFLDRSSLETLQLRKQPKIITILAVQNSKKQWLVLERMHQPFLHYRGFPSGKLHYGEALDEAAQRELKEKANLTDIPLTLRGSVLMRFADPKDPSIIANHVLGYVFSGAVKTTTPEFTHKHYRTFWSDMIDSPDGKNFKGHTEIMKLLSSDKLFIKSLDFVSDY